ncbi:MAG: leucine-rich repeat protein [Clostridia bacterium]|nr:leucine-rich repeat protein [Clostridia bacterium]
MPSSLIHIEYYAFKSTGLTSVKIPFATRYIESQAFFTSTLKTLYIHSQIEELSSTAFYPSSITTVYFTGKSTWEQMIALNSAYSYISGTKTYVSTYSLD